MARKALGRGLDALIPAGSEPPEGEGRGEGLINLALDKITAGNFQPRRGFEEAALRELAESIKSQGVLQPLLVRPRTGGGFELIAGERRFRAARLAGLSTVPALVREVDDRTALEFSLVENIQREDLDPIEQAEAYQRLLTDFDYTQEELSARVGKDRATVANLLRLLKLPEEVKDDLREGIITAGHARALLMAESPKQMLELHRAIVEQGISVREAEDRARGGAPAKRRKARGGKAEPSSPEVSRPDLHLRQAEESLIRALGTKVKVTQKGKGGRIEIQYFSAEEFNRIYRLLVG